MLSYLIIGLTMYISTELILAVALKHNFAGNELGDLVKRVLGNRAGNLVKSFIIFVSVSTFIAAVLLTSNIIR